MPELAPGIPEHLEDNFVTDVDGYEYYWPSGNGHYAAHHLREIADELDKRNGPWNDIIEEYFEIHD